MVGNQGNYREKTTRNMHNEKKYKKANRTAETKGEKQPDKKR